MPPERTTAKHRKALFDYLSNPANEWPATRAEYAKAIGICVNVMYRHMSPDDISEIEQDALRALRRCYSPSLSRTDRKMLNQAMKGDVKAAKLMYERLEGLPRDRKEITGANGGPVEVESIGFEKFLAELIKKDS